MTGALDLAAGFDNIKKVSNNEVKDKISRFWHKVKASRKDPLLYFGPASAVLLLILVFFPYTASDVSDSSLLLSSISSQVSTTGQDPFLNQTDKYRPESPDFILVDRSSLKAALPPGLITPQVLGALVDGSDPSDAQNIIVEYLVEPGETLLSLAAKFNISLSTILWANNLNQNSLLSIGQKLIIPPVSGVIHHVKSGDTVSAISQKYQAKAGEIVAFNKLSGEADIFIGDILIVPSGILPKAAAPSAYAWTPLPSSYFICPIASPCRVTQGLHWYNAVDFSHGTCGEPIYAAAGGTVLKVRLTNSTSRWAFEGAGNHITILHPNGVVTFYGHLQTSFVNPGDAVSQGQIIALMGGQPGAPGAGKSTACHVHFGVSGARNPFAK